MKHLASNSETHIPQPPRRNPFKAGSMLAQVYDGMLKAYVDVHHYVLREGGKARCMGNAAATAFWRGYDASMPNLLPRNAPVWACYRAGQAQRVLDDAAGVFVPPKSNSIVRPAAVQ